MQAAVDFMQAAVGKLSTWQPHLAPFPYRLEGMKIMEGELYALVKDLLVGEAEWRHMNAVPAPLQWQSLLLDVGTALDHGGVHPYWSWDADQSDDSTYIDDDSVHSTDSE
ncbi:hypothetical protein AAVH_18506 [Aphelenchoides avenae]|nr:hypothetical protein AAVH_18506 [Aphelenchus avenae]